MLPLDVERGTSGDGFGIVVASACAGLVFSATRLPET
jgi:hypothetical protein